MIEVNVSAKAAGKKLPHSWSVCVRAGRANEGLRANWLEHLDLAVRTCGFQYVHFHGLFHDDMFVYRERNGVVVYNWQYIDELFDRLLGMGIRPFVELGFCPGDLASSPNVCFWWKGHSSPPKDLGKWADLVEQFLRHCIGRYGEAEVRRWYFEVWNEPNLQYFFDGTRTQYFELYAVTARTIKKVDPLLRVGGPATCNFVADERFAGEKEDHSATRAITLKTSRVRPGRPLGLRLSCSSAPGVSCRWTLSPVIPTRPIRPGPGWAVAQSQPSGRCHQPRCALVAGTAGEQCLPQCGDPSDRVEFEPQLARPHPRLPPGGHLHREDEPLLRGTDRLALLLDVHRCL